MILAADIGRYPLRAAMTVMHPVITRDHFAGRDTRQHAPLKPLDRGIRGSRIDHCFAGRRGLVLDSLGHGGISPSCLGNLNIPLLLFNHPTRSEKLRSGSSLLLP